jgi:hypothetical protein
MTRMEALEAAAAKVRIWCASRPDLNGDGEIRHDTQALFDATAALAVAEEAGAGVFVVPENDYGFPMSERDEGWQLGHNACRAATLAGRVTL